MHKFHTFRTALTPHTAIAILNYNGRHHLAEYLPGVIQHANGCSIYVIDNASTDDSVAYLRQYFPHVNLVVNDRNYGFAGGYNKGLEKIQADIYILLNSDIAVTPGWLEAPLSAFTDKNMAACQPKIRALKQPGHFEHAGASGGYIDRFGFPFCRGRIFDHVEADNGQYDTPAEVFWATGACLFIRATVFWEAGGFDDDFFAHMEEIDLCWRIRRMGYGITVQPASVVYHLGGGTLQYMSPFKTRLNFRNNLFLLHKNLRRHVFITLFWRMVLDGIAAWKFLLTGYGRHTWAIFMAHMAFYGSLRRNHKKRKAFKSKINPKVSYPLTGWYNRSIVADYFIRKKKTFDALRFKA